MARDAGEPVTMTVACEHRTVTLKFNARSGEDGQLVFFGAARSLIYSCPACASAAEAYVDPAWAFVAPGGAS